MKRYMLLIILILLTSGCFKKEETKNLLCVKNTITEEIYVTGNDTYVNGYTGFSSSYVKDRMCDSTKTVVNSYDRNGNVNCYDKYVDYTYKRKANYDEIISEYEKKDYKCVTYGDYEENKKVVGSWCGEDGLSKYKYTFYSDGRLEIGYDYLEYSGNDYRNTHTGYYSVNDNKISVVQSYYAKEMLVFKNELEIKDNLIIKNEKYEYKKCN